jgi:hypothetical protein
MERRHYKKARTTKARAKNGKARIGASLTSENGWVLGSLLRTAKRQLQDWLQGVPRMHAAHSRDSEQSLHVTVSDHFT